MELDPEARETSRGSGGESPPSPEPAAESKEHAPAPEAGEGRFARSLVPLFVTPFALVGSLVALALVFYLFFAAGERSPEENLDRVLRGGANERWQAAFELQRQLQSPDEGWVPSDAFVERLVLAFEKASGDDPEIRQFLAAVLGYSRDPRCVPALLGALRDPGEDGAGGVRVAVVFALGAIGDDRASADLARLLRASADDGLRMAAANALARMPAAEAVPALREALAAPGKAEVRWNAAFSLAAHNEREGVVPVLLEMVDRRNLEHFHGPTQRLPGIASGPTAEELRETAIVQALQALVHLRATEAIPAIERLLEDANPRVQNAAMRALRELRPTR